MPPTHTAAHVPANSSFEDTGGQRDKRHAARADVRELGANAGCVGDDGEITVEARAQAALNGADADEIHATHAALFEQNFAPLDRVNLPGGFGGYARSRGRNSARANENTVDHFWGRVFR